MSGFELVGRRRGRRPDRDRQGGLPLCAEHPQPAGLRENSGGPTGCPSAGIPEARHRPSGRPVLPEHLDHQVYEHTGGISGSSSAGESARSPSTAGLPLRPEHGQSRRLPPRRSRGRRLVRRRLPGLGDRDRRLGELLFAPLREGPGPLESVGLPMPFPPSLLAPGGGATADVGCVESSKTHGRAGPGRPVRWPGPAGCVFEGLDAACGICRLVHARIVPSWTEVEDTRIVGSSTHRRIRRLRRITQGWPRRISGSGGSRAQPPRRLARPAARGLDLLHRGLGVGQERAWPSTPSTPRGSGGTSRASPATPASSSARCPSPRSTGSTA